jgi:hypothetical protein
MEIIKMAYGTFNSVAEVAKKFDIEVADKSTFFKENKLAIPHFLFFMVEKNLKDKISYVSEYAICETLIRPILDIVADNYALKVWSHIPYNVDKEKGLIGEPDYLIATKTKYGDMATPSLCIIEAKKENFDDGWTQALAAMIASASLTINTCYGIVTTGSIWQFAKLESSIFIIDPRSLSATTELQTVFNTINWLFTEISPEKGNKEWI